MKNSSVLVIGSIILSILLTSLGAMVFIKAQNTVSSSELDESVLVAYNNKLLKYEDDDVKGTTVKNLISEVNAINSNEENQKANIWVKLISEGENEVDLGETEIENSNKGICTYKASGISNSKTYSVTVVKYSDDGRIDLINITEN